VVAASGTDTIYAVNTCHPGDKADTVAFSTLPDTIGNYLTANYPGYTLKAAYKILDHSGTLKGYVVAVSYNSNPVGIAFDATGLFLKVLEQREGHDMHGGPGWHEGGRFGDRDGHHLDTVAIISALPSVITAYFSSNYPNDTLKHAFVNRDTSYLVISKDTGVYATLLKSSGTLIKRVQLYPHVVSQNKLTAADLPAVITTYLATTYPAYVFENAFEVKLNGTVKAYLVVIDANSTKYLLKFDASGTFVKSVTVR